MGIVAEEIVLRGLAVSKGIGIGAPLFFSNVSEEVPIVQISHKEIDREIERYRRALSSSRKDLEHLHYLSLQEGSSEIVAILGTHLEMIQDPIMTTVIEDRIREMQHNTESVFHGLIEEYKERFRSLPDDYFQERVDDIIDVSKRILSHLQPLPRMKMTEIPHNSIILAHELVPSETVEAQASAVSAFVTSVGGITSHAAIIARAKGIPYVANIDLKIFKGTDPHALIVDGSEGLVIINPSLATLKKYEAMKKGQLASFKQLRHASRLKGETIDGYEVKIFANLENPQEISALSKHGAFGVGLFRSEYLFLSQKQFPSEEEQFEVYKKMARGLKGKPLVIRIFDIGGDKKVDLSPSDGDYHYFANVGAELNPALGCRAIRFLLRYPEILRSQLRAILRASAYGDIHILIPMVSDISELRQVRAHIAEIAQELKLKGVRFCSKIPVGCMIEVPSSAIMCDVLAAEADFLSIGTNDLVQYVVAADRSNPSTSDLYSSLHPSILRLVRTIVTCCNEFKKDLILCGELAADPLMIPILIGLGIREFSVSARHIPLVKHTIRQWRILEACRLADDALEYTATQDLHRFLADVMRRRC